MKPIFKKIMGGSFIVGMASVFCPTVIQVDYLDMPDESDEQCIADDWKAVGSYIMDAYESSSSSLT